MCIYVTFRFLCAFLLLPVCLCVHAVWRLRGVREGTDGSCSGLVWCSLPAKDQAKTVTALCTLFGPAQQSKNRHLSVL